LGTLEKPERVIVIGDVHGCVEELIDLIEKIELAQDDLLIFVGDLLHKGPDCGLVVEYVMELAEINHVVLVWGNHEEKHMRWLRHEQRRLETGRQNPTRHVKDYPNTQNQLDETAIDFLAGKTYPVYMYYRFPGHIVTHAGIPRCLQTLPDNQSLSVESSKALPKKQRYRLKMLYRVRYENSKGYMVSMGDESPTDHYWAEKYDGRFGHCVFGHQPVIRPLIYKHATGIDTGCVYGQNLTAYVYHIDSATSHTVSVPANRAYILKHQFMNRDPEEEH